MNEVEISTADNDVRYVPDGTVNFCGIAHESRYQWALEQWDFSEKVVLDFGCGSGYGTYMLARKAKKVIGVDYSETAIEYAKKKHKAHNVEFKTLNACSQGIDSALGKNSFDVIVSFDVIEHIEKYFDYLNNILLLIKPEGVLIIGCPNRLETLNWNKSWNPFHFQEFSPYQLRKLLSLYFHNVQLYSQDFKDKVKREQIRLRRTGKSKRSKSKRNRFKRIIQTVLSLKVLPLPPVIRTWVDQAHKSQMKNNSECEPGDMEFQLEPVETVLQSAFGLIASCSLPKQLL